MTSSHIKLDKLIDLTKTQIRNERIALELSQKEFSDFVGLKFSSYRYFEQNGKISFENFLLILLKLNKDIEFENFLKGFEFTLEKERVGKLRKSENISNKSIIPPSQKQIVLDKQIFGNDLFYSVENGHLYDVPTFISIVLSGWNDKRLMLLLKYFGIDRLKPYVLREKKIDLLKAFNKHVAFLEKRM